MFIIHYLYQWMIMIDRAFVVLKYNTMNMHIYWKITMYNKLIPILTAILLFALVGCNSKTAEEKAPEAKLAAEANEAKDAKDANAQKPVDPEKLARDRARSQQLMAEGKIIPPRAEIIFKAGKIDGKLSVEDAERSYIYRKNAARRCYMYELAYREEAKGVVKATIRHEAPQKSTIVDYTSAIDSEEFNSCLKEAFATWSLPEGVTLEFSLDFSSKPAPTLQEIRESNRGLHGHDHGDMDHDHGDMDHEHGHEPGEMDHDGHEGHEGVPNAAPEVREFRLP